MNRPESPLTWLAARLVWPIRLVAGRTTGSWMFRGRGTRWLAFPPVRRQLPLPHRLFARWCTLREPPLPGSEALFHLAAACLPSRDDGIRGIDLPWGRLHLDLRDPRCVRAPDDLVTASTRLAPLLGPGDTLIDVGANHGAFAVVAARLVGPTGRVIAFEPQPRLADAARRSLTDHAECRWDVHAVACGDRHGEVDLFVPGGSSGAAGVHRRYSGGSLHRTVRVPLRTVDASVTPEGLTGRVVMKIDVEGSESVVLEGAAALLRSVRPVILLEVNPVAMRAAGTTPASLATLLRSLGYDRYRTHDARSAPDPLPDEAPAGDIVLLPADAGSVGDPASSRRG